MGTVPAQRTWTAGETVTAAMLNANVRDAVNWFISARPLALMRQTAAQAITTGTFTAINMDTEDVDRDGGHSTSVNTSRYTAQTAGWHLVTAIGALAADAASVRNVRLAVNGTASPASQVSTAGSASFNFAAAVSRLVFLNVGDYVEVQVQHNKGSNLNTSVANEAPHLSVMWVGS